MMHRTHLNSLAVRMALLAGTAGLALASAAPAQTAPGRNTSATADKALAGLSKTDGYVPFYWDEKKGRVLLEIPAFDEDILYYVSAATNPGSVEVSIDRGVIYTAVIHFTRSGDKVVVNQINLDYRALNGSAKMKEGTADSFPTSVLAVLPVESDAGGKVVVDGTSLFMRDAGNVTRQFKRSRQGDFRFDPAKSVFYPKRMKAFPENTEIETISTFTSDAPGAAIQNVMPAPGVFSMRVHHSFLKAPTGYVPREADPRIGVGAVRFKNFSKDFDDSPDTAWIRRWRLEKKDPNAAMSEPKKPITYYFDPAIPDPIRKAMKEGLLWWNKSFEKAGFINAIEAKDAPDDMDPMDIRYAYVLWIQRDERGFSSSGNFGDPRTGEILGSKTHMDTYRMRTIGNYYDSYSGSLPTDGSGVTVADPSLLTPGTFEAMPKGQRDMILLRQALLTAHELGHTFGFGHNWAANMNDRSSVMEYPTPRVTVKDGKLDISTSFLAKTGAYDDYMTRFAYTQFAPGQEKTGLDGVLKNMRDDGVVFTLGSDPRWIWYDDRATPMEALKETAAVRKIALANYGPSMLKPGEALGELRDMRLWMTYLHQRYAIEAGQAYIGGLFQNIVVKGEANPPPATAFIPPAAQRETLGLLLDAISPASLAIPESLLAVLTPHPGVNLEDLSKDAVFDQLRAARILAAMTLEPLFAPDRAARMIALAARKPDMLTFPQMVDAVMTRTWKAPAAGTVSEKALLRVTQNMAMLAMMKLGGAKDTAPEARYYVLDQLGQLATDLKARKDADPLTQAFYRESARQIAAYLDDPEAHAPKDLVPEWGETPRSRNPLPPGPPL